MSSQKLVFCFLLGGLLAKNSAKAQVPTIQPVFNHMAFPVSNLDSSVAFYQKVLGLKEITNRSQNPNIRWMSLQQGKELHLIASDLPAVKVNKALHLALQSTNIDSVSRHLRKMGVRFSNWAGTANVFAPRADGVMQLYLQDPDGYWIEINNGYSAAPDTQALKDEIWKLEEAYWVYVKNKDFSNYQKLWHDQFMGYPSTNIIGGKANITDWMKDMYARNEGNELTYQLDRKVENVFDDIVIVLYDAAMTWVKPDGTIASHSNAKLTHTWMKTGNRWLIIGGIGAVK